MEATEPSNMTSPGVPGGQLPAIFIQVELFCFWTSVSERNSNCTQLPSVFISQRPLIHAVCDLRSNTALAWRRCFSDLSSRSTEVSVIR